MSKPRKAKTLRETDVCPSCFKRDKLFELELFEVHSQKEIPVWGCHRCEIVVVVGSDYRRQFEYSQVMRLVG